MISYKEYVFHSLVPVESKIRSAFFGIGLFFLIWHGGDLIRGDHYFLFMFFGSLCFYFLVHPWTQVKEICVSDYELSFGEVIAHGVHRTEETLALDKIQSIELSANAIVIQTTSQSVIKGRYFELKVSPFQIDKIGSIYSAKELKTLILKIKNKELSLRN